MKKYAILLVIIISTFFGSIYALEKNTQSAVHEKYQDIKLSSKKIINNDENYETTKDFNKSKQPDFKLLLLLPVYLIGLILFRSRHHKFFIR